MDLVYGSIIQDNWLFVNENRRFSAFNTRKPSAGKAFLAKECIDFPKYRLFGMFSAHFPRPAKMLHRRGMLRTLANFHKHTEKM
ncbi:MAG: hypothetical protein IJ055_10160 [Oscillospiraceae bacterium]|nr:hypothetical protein [Oscillospiraceae bacterium]